MPDNVQERPTHYWGRNGQEMVLMFWQASKCLGSRPGYIDPTADLTPEDRQYLRSLPSMNHFINIFELHDWETPPDAAFTMACAGLLRECLQDEGHSLASIRSFAGEMLRNHQQPHPPAEAQASDEKAVSASSTRSRSRTPPDQQAGTTLLQFWIIMECCRQASIRGIMS